MSIKYKVLLPSLILTIVSIATILITVMVIFTNYVEDVAAEEVEISSEVLLEQVENLRNSTKLAAMLIAADDELREAMHNNDNKAASARMTVLMGEIGMDFATLMDTEGVVLYRVHNPSKSGDNLSGQSNVTAAINGQVLTTTEAGSEILLSVRSGAPVRDADGTLLAVVSTGLKLDEEEFVDSIKELTGSEATIFRGTIRLMTTLFNENGSRMIGSELDNQEVIRTVLEQGKVYAAVTMVGGREMTVNYQPLHSGTGTIVGMIFTGRYTETQNAVVQSFILSALLAGFILLGLSVPLVIYIARRVVAPVTQMVNAADHLSVGDMDVEIDVKSKDEMLRLGEAFKRMIESNREQARLIRSVADGDLTVLVQPRCDKDIIGIALRDMIVNNHNAFIHIRNASDQVSSGSRQIAEGAQTLAQGSTEQAAAVEQLSTSISNVSGSIQNAAGAARGAAQKADGIRRKAEQGSSQMHSMLSAVQDINAASQSIGKVITVIDNIAFQTNILALNAAVEAARAGQHGRGFAVVAEEVRSLAAKSADAAKETGVLIQNSIEKAELGARIAAETNTSLQEIVAGINETSVIVSNIAVSAEEQAAAIKQINTGIDQVAQVVQQNSATAEESAAASDEMSGQSALLHELVSAFTLQDDRPLLNAGRPAQKQARLHMPPREDGYGKY